MTGLAPFAPPPAERGARAVFGTVASVDPFTVTVDGDTAPSAAARCVDAASGARVVCLAGQGRLVAIAALDPCPHAVGDYYLTESATSPEARWPGTSWTALAGRVLVGLDPAQPEFDLVGEQGGSKAAVTLAHTHPATIAIGWGSGGGPSIGRLTTNDGNPDLRWDATVHSAGVADTGAQNLQPYRVCRVWRRVA